MENIHNTYKYAPLDRERNEIRVLELLPGVDPQPIEGRLRILTLDDPSPWDALSYAWGDVTSTKPITLEGDDNFQIPATLQRALYDLRKPDASLFIWIDAICIDQWTTAERNHQVQLMRRIYKKALTVCIWIDVEVDASAAAFKKLAVVSESGEELELGDDPSFWQPVIAVLSNRYWSRVWVQQEIASATKLSLLCRRSSVSAANLLIFAIRCLYESILPSGVSKWLHVTTEIDHFMKRFSIDFITRAPALGMREQSNPNADTVAGGLLGLLDSARGLGCQNPRDRVYGLMHLAPDYEEGSIEIDYDLPVAEVYCSVVSYMVEMWDPRKPAGCLTLLCAVSPQSLNTGMLLPSWCPDWSKTLGPPALDWLGEVNNTIIFAPGICRGKRPWLCSTDSGKRLLNAQGIMLDSILALCPPDTTANFQPLHKVVSDWIATALAGTNTNQFTHELSGPVSLQMLRTLTMGWKAGNEQIWEAWRDLIIIANDPDASRDFWESLVTQVKSHETSAITPGCFLLISKILSTLQRRAFFKGVIGSLGLAPKESLVHDQIWILFDCPFPVVLRPAGEDYIVVGTAYVDGFMNGEACEDMPDIVAEGEKYGRFGIKTVRLR
ncbi:heterokaryon incompatibility protein-domain-containing protein [Rhexocercosporidium sp. MPI-PUGE-AT-0058]|nr:heterokaryon incompatibility protein-domain-containing protein [Rhexocercosporidium sp. MPI-PUGE-AT-0058]